MRRAFPLNQGVRTPCRAIRAPSRQVFVAAAVGLATLGAAILSAAAAEPLRLRVLSYNIHHGAGTDGKLDIQRIAAVIKAAKPDVVALQEVDQKTDRAGRVDQLAELERLTGDKGVFGGNIKYQGGDYGNAVLSRWPIVRHENHRLPLVGRGEQRGMLEVELRLPGRSDTLIVLATHLDARGPDVERRQSAEAINALAAERPGRALLLAGDVNDTPASPTLKLLAATWQRANEQVVPTIPVEKPVRQIDFVLFAPPDRWKTIEFRTLDDRVASDHRPVLAVLEIDQGAR